VQPGINIYVAVSDVRGVSQGNKQRILTLKAEGVCPSETSAKITSLYGGAFQKAVLAICGFTLLERPK
jgi:hypothetical protein